MMPTSRVAQYKSANLSIQQNPSSVCCATVSTHGLLWYHGARVFGVRMILDNPMLEDGR